METIAFITAQLQLPQIGCVKKRVKRWSSGLVRRIDLQPPRLLNFERMKRNGTKAQTFMLMHLWKNNHLMDDFNTFSRV